MKTKIESRNLPLYITEKDKTNLLTMIDEIKRSKKQESELNSLAYELDRAHVVNDSQIGRNVVTMHSTVSIIDSATSERLKFTLVYPDQANATESKISVLSPIGSGMLGFSVGDEFEWQVPSGLRKFTIAKVDNQPQANAKPNR